MESEVQSQSKNENQMVLINDDLVINDKDRVSII